MIAARQDILWIRTADGRLEPLDGERLAARVCAAVTQCGELGHWWGEALAAALQQYVSRHSRGRVITVRQLERLTIRALVGLGLDDVVAVYGRQKRLCQEIRLDELAQRAGAGFELEFFRQLDAVLRQAASADLLLVQLRGLRSCVRRLRAARQWSRGCRELAEDIVRHARRRLEDFGRRRPAMQLLIGD